MLEYVAAYTSAGIAPESLWCYTILVDVRENVFARSPSSHTLPDLMESLVLRDWRVALSTRYEGRGG